MTRISLDNLSPGQSGVITAVGGNGALRRRLLDMGLTPRTSVLLRKVAPMGDPLELHLRSYTLTLRKEEAAKIEIDPESVTTANGESVSVTGTPAGMGCGGCAGCSSCGACTGSKKRKRGNWL
ncbi:MAG: FeoA family protein [Angelakisella sp.]